MGKNKGRIRGAGAQGEVTSAEERASRRTEWIQKLPVFRKHHEITLFILGFTEQENLPQHPTSSHLSPFLGGQEQKPNPPAKALSNNIMTAKIKSMSFEEEIFP